MSTGKVWTAQLAPSFAPSFAPVTSSAGSTVVQGISAAAPMALGVATAIGVVFLTRAALRQAADLDARDRELAAMTRAQRAENIAWDTCFAEVATRNARILRLRELSSVLAGAGTLPADLLEMRFTGQSREEVNRWCLGIDQTLARAEEEVRVLRIAAALRHPVLTSSQRAVRLRAERYLQQSLPSARRELPADTPSPRRPEGPPPGAGPSPAPTPASPLTPTEYTSAPQPGEHPPPSDPTDPGGRSDPSARDRRAEHVAVVDQMLGTLAGRVGADDFVRATQQAERVLAAPDGAAFRAELDELYLLSQEARSRQDQRTTDAAQAAQWLVGLAALDAPTTGMALAPGPARILAELRAVAAELRELDDTLRTEATDLFAAAHRAAHQRTVAETFAQVLREQGCDVTLDLETGKSVHVSAAFPGWGGDRAEIDVTGRDMDARFVRTSQPGVRSDLHLQEWEQAVSAARKAAVARDVEVGVLHFEGSSEASPSERNAAYLRWLAYQPDHVSNERAHTPESES